MKEDNRSLMEKVADAQLELENAVENNLVDLARKAIEAGADVNMKDRRGDSHLHQAIWNGHTEIARLLIEKGADVNAKNETDNRAPLHIACSMLACGFPIARELIAAGAKIDSPDNGGYTPLHWACSRDEVELVRFLLDHGADVNARSKDRETPFHFACQNGHIDTAKLLADRGGDPGAEDVAGKTPLDCALKIHPDKPKREAIIEWYREHYPEMVFERFCTAGPEI